MKKEIVEKSFGNKDKSSMTNLDYFFKNWIFDSSNWMDQGRNKGYVYFLYNFKDNVFKVGITTACLKKRFYSYKNTNFYPLFAIKHISSNRDFLKESLVKEENSLKYHLSKILSLVPNSKEFFKINGMQDLIKLKKLLADISFSAHKNYSGSILNKSQIPKLKNNEYEFSEKIHDPKFQKAFEIFNDFNTNHQPIHLVAPMQSGKTEIIAGLAALCHGIGFKKYPNKVAGVFILNGMNDKGWTEQTQERMPVYLNNGSRPFVETAHLLAIPNLNNVLSNIKAPCLLVLDESHYGTDANGLIDDFLNKLNIKLNANKMPEETTHQDLLKNLQLRGVYILFVSATDYYTQKKCEDYSHEFFKEIRMIPSKKYIGVKELFDLNAIHQSFDLLNGNSLSSQCKKEIDSLVKKRKYCIFRTKPKEFYKVKNALEKEYGDMIDVVEYHSQSFDTFDSVFMNNKPEKTTIVLIKNYWRASKTLPKTHLGLFYDRSTENTATTLQSAVGRCCGYFDYNVCNFKIFTNMVIVLEHLGIVDQTGMRTLDSKTKISPEKIGSLVSELHLKEIDTKSEFKLLKAPIRYSKEKTALVRKYVPDMKNAFFRNRNGVFFRNTKNGQLENILKRKNMGYKKFQEEILSMDKEMLNFGGCFGKGQTETLIYEAISYKGKNYLLSYVIKKGTKRSLKMYSKMGIHD